MLSVCAVDGSHYNMCRHTHLSFDPANMDTKVWHSRAVMVALASNAACVCTVCIETIAVAVMFLWTSELSALKQALGVSVCVAILPSDL